MKNLTNSEALILVQAVSQMGAKEIDDLDTAMALVEINHKLSQAMKNNEEAVNKTVVFTQAEKECDATLRQLTEKLTQAPESEKADITAEIEQHRLQNKEVNESINQKNQKIKKASAEMGAKPCKIELPKIDKTKLPKGLMLWQYAALKPILK